MTAIPFRRDLRYLEAAGRDGWLPLPMSGTGKPSESLKSNLSNSQSFVWILDRGRQRVVSLRQAQPCPMPMRSDRGRKPAAGKRHPFPSPRPAIGAGVSHNFSQLFLGGVL